MHCEHLGFHVCISDALVCHWREGESGVWLTMSPVCVLEAVQVGSLGSTKSLLASLPHELRLYLWPSLCAGADQCSAGAEAVCLQPSHIYGFWWNVAACLDPSQRV